MLKSVDIIIVNWNSGELTYEAVKPYLGFNNNIISCNVIVVDNHSTDHSVQYLNSKNVPVIENGSNYGFARACNIAYQTCTADYVLLLNPDTTSSPEVLSKLVDFMENNLDYGCTGPLQINTRGEVMRSCGRFPNFKNSLFEVFGLSKLLPSIFKPPFIMADWDHSSSKDVDHIMGSYMLLRKSVLKKTGFLDTDFFMYMEDIDLSKRIVNNGNKCFFNSSVSIYHQGGGTGEPQKGFRLRCFLISRCKFWKKHLNKTSWFILTIVSATVEPLLRIFESIIGKNKTSVGEICNAYKIYISEIKSISIQ